MAKGPWWKATKTRTQARNGGLLWGVLTLVWWVTVSRHPDQWWAWLAAVASTYLAVSYIASWCLWRPEWDGIEGRKS
jgi:hypothetical protein